jgi:BolA family transcriptional regulator, general stress-responsive regulator
LTAAELLAADLRARFPGAAVEVVDESAAHAGHTGAAGGESHFAVRVVTAEFEGVGRLERHRLVYEALQDRFSGSLHALRLRALTPAEAAASA